MMQNRAHAGPRGCDISRLRAPLAGTANRYRDSVIRVTQILLPVPSGRDAVYTDFTSNLRAPSKAGEHVKVSSLPLPRTEYED